MPELPEVETIARDLRGKVIPARIEQVRVFDPRVVRGIQSAAFRRQLKGRTLSAVERRGKALVFTLAPGPGFLVVQLMMTGQLIARKGLTKERETKVVFELSNGMYLHYNDQRLFGRLSVVRALKDLGYFCVLGPEPLEAAFSPGYLCRAVRNRRSGIKTLLLNHAVVAGIGNIYASEILFDCRVDPRRPACSLDEAEAAALVQSARRVLRAAIKARGTSMRSYRDADGNEGGFKNFLQVYGRYGLPCRVCGHRIQRIISSGRSTFFCPQCQR